MNSSLNLCFDRLLIASDHAGLSYKYHLQEFLNHEFPDLKLEDLGPQSAQSVDYPDYAHKLCGQLAEENKQPGRHGLPAAGLLICGSGIGMSIAANRHAHVRAALLQETLSAKLTREHNNANVCCLGARITGLGMAEEIVKIFLSTVYAGGRHEQRLEKINFIK